MTTVAEIQRVTADVFGVSLSEMTGGDRHKHVVDARHMAILIARTITGKSTPDLGRHFRRDHTSIISALTRIRGRLAEDADLRAMARQVEARLGIGPYAAQARTVEPLP